MLRRTRKWAHVQQEAKRLVGLGMSAATIATRLDVDASTVHRWLRAGKLTRDKRSTAAPRRSTNRHKQTPAQWAASVRATFALDPTDVQLVLLGQAALELAKDHRESPATRIAATARFQAIAKQLQLAMRPEALPTPEQPPAPPPTQEPSKARPLRSTNPDDDPRRVLLMPVK